MAEILPFPQTPSTVDGEHELDRFDVIGQRLVAVRQSPWMAPVCIQGADGQTYECRIFLEIEADYGLELSADRLSRVDKVRQWERIRPEEHLWNTSVSPTGQVLTAVGKDPNGRVVVILERGLLTLGSKTSGPLRFEPLDPTAPSTRERLSSVVDYWSGRPVLAG